MWRNSLIKFSQFFFPSNWSKCSKSFLYFCSLFCAYFYKNLLNEKIKLFLSAKVCVGYLFLVHYQNNNNTNFCLPAKCFLFCIQKALTIIGFDRENKTLEFKFRFIKFFKEFCSNFKKFHTFPFNSKFFRSKLNKLILFIFKFDVNNFKLFTTLKVFLLENKYSSFWNYLSTINLLENVRLFALSSSL